MPAAMLRAPAKLNLFLHILGKREDGYHAIESLVVFTEFADTLRIDPADALAFDVDGEFAAFSGDTQDNLVLKAARTLQAKANVTQGAKLTLTKNIPVGAGLGGGSADAAAALRGLNRFWNANLTQRELKEIASTLGADVAMCLDSTPAIARGIGDELTPLLTSLPKLHVLLVHPRTPLLTKDVYGAFELGAVKAAWDVPQAGKDFLPALSKTRNDLQRAAIQVNSLVAEVLLTLETLQPQADFVRMTGSGACCFALYRDATQAKSAAKQLQNAHPEWWVKVTSIA